MRLRSSLLLISTMLLRGDPIILLSLDGLSAQQFSRSTMPQIWKLSAAGWRGRSVPPTPCTTFNGHASLATGCWPGHHGVVSNHFLDPQQGYVAHSAGAAYLDREPLWVAATRNGIRTALFHWPCGEQPWQGVKIWRQVPFSSRRTDEQTLKDCEQAVQEGAQLIMAWLSGVDDANHSLGPTHPKTKQVLKRWDLRLKQFVSRIRSRHPRTAFVLTADHGAVATPHRFGLAELLQDLPVRVSAHGGSAYVYATNGSAGPEIQKRLQETGFSFWPKEEIPERFRLLKHPRVGDWFVSAPLGTWISHGLTPESIQEEKASRTGAHGYDGSLLPMHAWLVVLGTSSKGDLGTTEMWNLAPTVAQWLGISWTQAPDGQPLAQLNKAWSPNCAPTSTQSASLP